MIKNFALLLLSSSMIFAQDVVIQFSPGNSYFDAPDQVLTGTVTPADASLTLNNEPVTVDNQGQFT